MRWRQLLATKNSMWYNFCNELPIVRTYDGYDLNVKKTRPVLGRKTNRQKLFEVRQKPKRNKMNEYSNAMG